MLLNSIFLLVIILSNNIYILLSFILLFGIVTFITKKKIVILEKKYYIGLVVSVFIIQLFFNKEGRIIYENTIFTITETGILLGAVSSIKIWGMIFVSKNSDFRKLFNGKFKKQALIFEIVFKIVPEILKMPKTLLNPGKTVKYILKRVYKELQNHKD